MSDTQQLALSIQPIISYPRQAQVGKTYLMTIDLQSSENEWPYEEEEYPIYCMLDTSPLFSCEPLDEPAVVLHRFGGSYGAAEFLLTAAQEEMQGEITVTLVSGWGVPIRVLSLGQISITQGVTHSRETTKNYERVTSVPQQPRGNSSISNTRNPFIVGKPVPPEFFVGREDEIAVSFDQISSPAHLAIWGGPGMGKSSILELLASPAVWEKHGLDPSKAVIALLSCDDITPFTASGFWQKVLSVMKDNLESEPLLETEIDQLLEQKQATWVNINNILQKLGKKQKFLVLLVNDFDVALQKNRKYTEANMQKFLSDCRRLAVNSQRGRYLSMVVTSLKRLSELSPKLNPNVSPWYNHYLFQQIKLLNDQEIEELLSVMPMTRELREAIKEIAGGHPTLLQIAGFLLYAQLETDRKANKVSDVQEFIKNFEMYTRHIFQITWDRCSEIEQTLLILLALFDLKGRLHNNKNFDLGNIDLIFTQRGRELTNLEEKGVIFCKIEKEKTLYSFTSLMMHRWVIQEMWNNNEVRNTNNILIPKRQKVYIKLISDKQLHQIDSIWKQKDEIISTVEWFGKLVAAFPQQIIEG
jgi:hypothetical protein